ncbi:MAG: two-component regulator propeller domain-containing protein [Woeseiaceae bacterium]|nr:two-component regulator propeller domain-containing protein [Woeseiaceae bacterium]
MRFDHLALDQGLSQSNILSILQDSEGYMWFGTENGLNRYNGYEFDHFKRERGNPDALANDFIFDVAEDADGNLWIATNGGGLAMLDRESGAFVSYRHDANDAGSIGSNVVRRVLVDEDGSIWAGTRGAGLSRLDRDSGRFDHHRFETEAGPDNIFVLAKAADGVLWVGGDHGLSRFDTTSGESLTWSHDADNPGSLSKHSVRALLEDADGTLWVGTYGGGLHRYDVETRSFERFTHDADDESSISGDRVTAIFEDSAGRLWAGTTTGLNLVDRDSGHFVRYYNEDTDPSSLADNSITVIYEDRAGVLWVGTKMRGLSKWNSRTWSYGLEPAREITTSGEAQPNVTSFVQDDAGLLWIGTFGEGLNAVDRDTGKVTHYRHEDGNDQSIADDRVMSLLRDRNGMIWVGTMGRGISRLDPETGKFDHFRSQPDDAATLSANGIMAMYEDSAGHVWVGTFGGGISRFDRATNSFTRIAGGQDQPGSLSSNRVTSFVEDRNGNMWVGTDSGGLNLIDATSGKITAFRHDPSDPRSLADDTIYSLNVDADGDVWVGTRGGGVDRIVGNSKRPDSITFANISQADGLANDVVYGVHFDVNGHAWMSTNYGISKFDPASGEFRNLHRRDGLQSEEFNFGAHYQSTAGELFFGGHNGFNAFHPDKVQVNLVVPPVVMTGSYDMNDPTKADLPVDDIDGVELGYKDDVISFEFAALDYAVPEQNSYMYKLEGFDRDWIDLGNERRVTYTDLDAGSYLLRVKAANSDGTWNEAGFALPVTVAAAPWATWWAYTGYLAMIVQAGLFLWLAHKRKLRREEEYSNRLEQEVDARTEQLVDRNQQLKVLNEALQESSLSDPLTGLRNRRFVFEEVSRDLDVVRRRMTDQVQGIDQSDTNDLVFMMIDLDNFKPINDTYGHAAGDQMLLQVRDVLLDTCRRSDFVIRWGGDEFLVIAKQARPMESEALAERIRTRIAATSFTVGEGQVASTTCSIGFAAFPLFKANIDESSIDQIICLADGLMYEAKKQRDAWAGMFSPTEASTSYVIEDGELEPTSLLFRAKRAGKLSLHETTTDLHSARILASRHK